MTIEKLLKVFQKKFGSDIVMRGSDLRVKGPRIKFGIPDVDALIDGGIPVGRICECFSPEHVGKTTLAYKLIAEAQHYGTPMFIDAEGQWNKPWARKQGVNTRHLILMRPTPAETALQLVIDAAKRHLPLVVLDSVAAIAPVKEHQKEMDQRTPGQLPLLMNICLRKLLNIQRESPTIVLFLNQVREKMSIGRPFMYGDSIITPGGRGLKHFTHLRIELARTGYVMKQQGERRIKIGQKVAVQVAKSKISIPMRRAEIVLTYGQGFTDGALR